MKLKTKIEDGVYKISALDLYNFVYGENEHLFLQAIKDIYLDLIVQNEEEVIVDENYIDTDIMFGMEFIDKPFTVTDYYLALPVVFFMLFNWLQFSRNNNNTEHSKKIWQVLFFLIKNKKFFNLKNTNKK